MQDERITKLLDYHQCGYQFVWIFWISMGPLENERDIKEKERSESDHSISGSNFRSCRQNDRGIPTTSNRSGIKYLTRARSRFVQAYTTRRSDLEAMNRRRKRIVLQPPHPRVRPAAAGEIKGGNQEKKTHETWPRDQIIKIHRSGSDHGDYVNKLIVKQNCGSKNCVALHENIDMKIEELKKENIDSTTSDVNKTFAQHNHPNIDGLKCREVHRKAEVKTQNRSEFEADEEHTIYIRYRTPSISPVLRTSSASEDSRLSPLKSFTENQSRVTSDPQATRRHSNFSISAILGRVSSTPKKEMSVSSTGTMYSRTTSTAHDSINSTHMQDSVYITHAQDSVNASHVQDSVYSTHVQESAYPVHVQYHVYPHHVTSNQNLASGRNTKVECESEGNMHNAASTEFSSSSCSSCNSCQNSTTEVARKKMERTKFPKEHVQILTDSFWKEPYPSSLEIEKLAKQLGHRSLQIKTWFQNKRASVTGTRRPKGQTSIPNITFQPDAKAPTTVLFPVPHSMIDKFVHQHHLVPRLTAQSGSFVTPSNTFASLTGHGYPLTASSYLVPHPSMGSVTSNSYIVPHPQVGSVATPHFSTYPPLHSFHYFGSQF